MKTFQTVKMMVVCGLVVVGVAAGVPGAGYAAPMPASFADLVEKYSPAVVNISTESEPKTISRPTPPTSPFGEQNPFQGSPFEDFFEEFFQNLPEHYMNNGPMRSLGSGVIISADGYVLTNSHVVDGADKIVVRLSDDHHEYDAKLVGRDPKVDVALLKIDTKDKLPFASLGNSDSVRVGDWVVAIGNPFGLGGTVTTGIISARGRNINMGPYDDFLQTDAAINPGNSGGPLFATDGQIIGINTAILTRSGGSQGIGFAIPSNTVKLIVEQIKEHGHPIRGWLGVHVQTVTKELADALGLKNDRGALVTNVVKGSPADKAGIKEGDVIMRFAGTEIDRMSELPRLVAQTEVGSKAQVELLRDGKQKTVSARIEVLDEPDAAAAVAEEVGGTASNTLGMSLQKLDAALRAQLGLDDNVKGVVVTNIIRAGAADRAGLRRGDVIMEVNREKVSAPEDVEKAVQESGDKSALLLVFRGDGNLFIALKAEEKK